MPDRVPPVPPANDAESLTLSNAASSDVLTDRTGRAALLNEIREVADKLERDNATRGDIKIICRAMRELRYAFKVFTPYRQNRKVTVFGSARTPADHPDYLASVEFGKSMAEAGWMVVTGAGGGIMEGAHEGAGVAMSMGVNIMLPFEQDANPIISKDSKLVTFKFFFTRKLMFVKEVHAIAMFPGGFGTQDELFEVLTLIQTGKRDLMPIVLVEQPGCDYWRSWRDFIVKHLLGRKLISEQDLSLFRICTSVDDAVLEIVKFYSVYNSMRYVRDKLILRLHAAPDDALLERINTEFADIVEDGRIERTVAQPQEYEDEHLHDLPRLMFQFNRRDAGRLRELVDLLNHEVRLP